MFNWNFPKKVYEIKNKNLADTLNYTCAPQNFWTRYAYDLP